MTYQSKTQKYLNVFVPSGLEMVFIVSVALMLPVLHYFEVIQQYIGLSGSLNIGSILKGWLDTLLNSTLGQGFTETFVVGLFWAMVGLGVYIFLRGVMKLLFDISESMGERGYVWPRGADRHRPMVVAIERTSFQVVVALILFFWVVQPVVRLLEGPVFVDAIGQSMILQYIIWVVLTVLSLHFAVVLLRLVLLRERVFD